MKNVKIIILVILLFLVLGVLWLWIVYLGDLYILEKDWVSQRKVVKFEKRLNNYYPYGNDRFYIDHGDDYFAFFKRLGDLYYIAKTDSGGKIVGTVACVLRKVIRWDPLFFRPVQERTKVWYIGDLKLDPLYRNQRFPLKLFLKYGIPFWFESSKVYAISMDSGSKPNRVLNLAQKIILSDFKSGGKLYIYSLNAKELKRIDHHLESHFGPYHFVDLKGVKDLVLESTDQKMKIKHLVRNCYVPSFKKDWEACDSYTYMFCIHSSDPFIERLEKLGITTNTTATIIHRGMDNTDWSFINTSEL